MGAVYEEFRRDLDRLQAACAGDPRREVVRLFLMALEREEIVSVGYRESLMDRRLAAMPLPADAREILRHALVWVWKDEEMHTIYIRGAILRLGGWWLRTEALATQVAGGLGGWASSVLHHSRWSQAPLSRSLAGLITFLGGLVGKVPADVRRHLQYGPFRRFCAFNIDAEKTAAVCWHRIADLAATQPDIAHDLGRDFRRVAEDEDRHGDVFRILHDALTDDDTLAPGVDAAMLGDRIRAVGEEYLPRARRSRSFLDNPLGSGAAVHVVEAGQATEKRALFRQLLVQSGLAESVRRRAEHLGRDPGSLSIVIKPTFMLGYDRRDPSPVTDVELVHDLADFLVDIGCSRITVIEGRSIYDRYYARRSVADVAAYFGVPAPTFRVVDALEEQVPHAYRRGMAQYTVARSWRDADFRISFPKIRSHPIEMALLSVGNIEWVGGRCDEYLFLERQADRATAVMMLLDEFPPHFALLDGFENVPDGLVGVMGCRRPLRPLRFYAGADPLAVDTVALRHLGCDTPPPASILRSCRQWFGDGIRPTAGGGMDAPTRIVGVDTPIRGWRGPCSSELRALLSMMAYPVYVMGSGRGRLFVPEMDEEAFPALEPEGWWLGLRRRAVRRLLGLHGAAS
jgi:uncharacterized protein (DUF362 family)